MNSIWRKAVGARCGLALLGALALIPEARAFKVYVFADMEGISGVANSEQVSGDRKDEGRALMAEDINACVAGCFDAGATEVVVRDGHGGGVNVDPSMIDPRAHLIQGATPGERYKNLAGAEAVILLGYHAMSLTPDGVLAHSYSSASIQRMRLNGREVGEIGVDAAIAAEHKIPVVMVSGCDKTLAEARAWLPGGVGLCETKKSTGRQSADLVPVETARRAIRRAAADAVGRRKDIPRIRVDYPATLSWDYLPKGSLRTHHPEFRPVDNPRRAERTGDSVERLLVDKPR
jgi:D-amino peptidase